MSNKKYKIIMTILLSVFYVIGAIVVYLNPISFVSLIWIYNYVYFTYFIYRIWFEERIILRKLLNSNDFTVLKINKINEYQTEAHLKHRINHWPFNEFEILTSHYNHTNYGETIEVMSLKTLNIPKHWFKRYFLGTGIWFYLNTIDTSSVNNNKKRYLNKIKKYVINHKKIDRQRKLTKIINLN